jgi:hypothetical protein
MSAIKYLVYASDIPAPYACSSIARVFLHVSDNWRPGRDFDVRDVQGVTLIDIRHVDPLRKLISPEPNILEIVP